VNELAFYLWAGRALAIVLALALLAWALRRQRQDFAGKFELLLGVQQQSRAEIAALTEKVAALATLVAAIPARVERPAEAPRAAPRREASPVRSYETARRLARSGATVEEIVATCGVAGTEARLLRRLHGGDLGRDSAA
jgi:hypothetical protein